MDDKEFQRHERAAWLRWGASLVVALLSAVIAGQCAGQPPQLPPPPPQVR